MIVCGASPRYRDSGMAHMARGGLIEPLRVRLASHLLLQFSGRARRSIPIWRCGSYARLRER